MDPDPFEHCYIKDMRHIAREAARIIDDDVVVSIRNRGCTGNFHSRRANDIFECEAFEFAIDKKRTDRAFPCEDLADEFEVHSDKGKCESSGTDFSPSVLRLT